jgi:hypothetical protein
MKFFTALLFILSLNIESSTLTQRVPLCSLVDNHITLDFTSENRWDNGYKEERYHHVLDTVYDTFAPKFHDRGGRFVILRDWSDGAVNAWASRQGNRYEIEVPGGMARYSLINEEAFLLTICHELGHLLGGYPHSNEISFEGQSDYYAVMKCMEPLLVALDYQQEEADVRDCEGEFCQARLRGIQSLTSYYAELARQSPPTLATPSLERPRQTQARHPSAQCRFDTMIASLHCENREDFSYVDALTGSCVDAGARPRCWFVQ